jgi:hypothetical protein
MKNLELDPQNGIPALVNAEAQMVCFDWLIVEAEQPPVVLVVVVALWVVHGHAD